MLSTWPVHNCSLAFAKIPIDLFGLYILFSQYRSCDNTQEVWSFVLFIKTRACKHEYACMHSHYMMMSQTPWDLTGTSNGGRSFTKSMHRKSALPFGISNSNLAGVIIGLQRSRKAKNKKKSKFSKSLSSIFIF